MAQATATNSTSNSSFLSSLWELPERRYIMGASIVLGLFFVAFFTIMLDPNGRTAQLLFDRLSPHFPYPFTIQNFEHVISFIALGELFIRWRVTKREMQYLEMNLLPEDDETVLTPEDLGPIRKRVAKLFNAEHGFVPNLIDISVLQFQAGRSVDQTVAVMTSTLDLIQHRVDLRYGLIRYIAWFIPTLGFIGTVIGLGSSLAAVPETGNIVMYTLAQTLAVGFDCTMVALVWSAVIVFCQQLIQEHEELAVNLSGTYVIKNLINRLYSH